MLSRAAPCLQAIRPVSLQGVNLIRTFSACLGASTSPLPACVMDPEVSLFGRRHYLFTMKMTFFKEIDGGILGSCAVLGLYANGLEQHTVSVLRMNMEAYVYLKRWHTTRILHDLTTTICNHVP